MLSLHRITCVRVPAYNTLLRVIVPCDTNYRDFANSEDNSGLPLKPKKPASSFLKYLRDSVSVIKEEYPDASYKDIQKIAAEKWRLCSSEFKKPYLDCYKKEKEDFFYSINSYESNLTEEQKAIIDEKKDCIAKKREKAKLKKGLMELGKPKRPPNPYALFIATHKGMKKPGEDLVIWLSRIASEWKNMPEIEKQPFFDKFKALRLQFEKDMDEWRKEVTRVRSVNPAIKKAQQKVLKDEERHREKILTPSPSSGNPALVKTVSYLLPFFRRLIESTSRMMSWNFSKWRTGKWQKS